MRQLCILFLFCLFTINAQAIEIAPEASSGFKSKPVLEATRNMVVSGSVLASRAGSEILAKGGNSIDAAIATQMVLNLVEPHASGIGGGGFLLYYNKKSGKVEALDGRETAPSLATADMFLDKNGNVPLYQEALKGGISVGTPGLLRMLEKAHKAHGKLPWGDLFTPAINIAESGFPMSPRLYKIIESTPYIAKSPDVKDLYFSKNNTIKSVGTIITNPALAETFRIIAKHGANGFYKGEIAKAIVRTVRNNPFKAGRLSEEDLTAYQAIERTALCSTYRDYKICGMPPPTSGSLAVIQSLKLLERFNLKPIKDNSPESIHLIMEALKLSFADRNAYVADCNFVPTPVNAMLSPKYIAKRSALINPKESIEKIEAGKLAWDKKCGKLNETNEHPSTTHMSIVDSEGNAVSMTTSIEYSFGSGIMARGFFLNNELTDFSLKPEINGEPVANRIEPGKRPRSSMAPMMVFNKKGELYMVIGSPGGSRIISYVLQTIVSVLDFHMKLNDAINRPHYATTGDAIELEKGTSLESLKTWLEEIGHKVIIGDLTSGLHGIEIKNNKLFSGVDSRREGGAVGE